MEHKKIGAGIIMIDKKSGDILLGRRSFLSKSSNVWAPFGGTIEKNKDSSPKEGAKREFYEETGANIDYEISKSPFYIQDNPYLTFYSYLGVTNDKFPIKISKEHLAYGWFPLEHLPSNLLQGFEELLRKKGEQIKLIIEKLKLESEVETN